KHSFRQKLPQNIATAGTDRFPHTDFFCPLGHAYQHDVHDSNTCGHESDKTNHERSHADYSRNRSERALERIIGINLEIVFLIRLQTARDAHCANAFIERAIVAVSGESLRRNVDGAFRFTVVLEESSDRHEAKIILTLAERCSFLGEHA